MPLPVPDRPALDALDDDAWARLVGHSRAALRTLPVEQRGPHGAIASASTVDLLSGAARGELARLLATGGALWERVAPALSAEDEEGWRRRLTAAPDEDVAEPTVALGGGGRDELVRTLRDRVRELTEQRAQARRQAEGADARARTLQEKWDQAQEEIAQLHVRIDQLEQRVAQAADERSTALERQRRQSEEEAQALRDEVRALRREREERALERRRREEAERAAQEAAARAEQDARRTARTGRQRARPGRPSVLPAGVQPGTSAAARALLTRRHLILVDGYNVTMTHRGQLDLEQQRTSLIATLEAAAARFGLDIEVLFDSRHGSPPGAKRSRTVRVRFTAPGVTADDEIAFEVSAQPEDRPVLVVTDDRELRTRVRPYAVDVLGTGEFLRAVE